MPTTSPSNAHTDDAQDVVPLRRQYLQIKGRYPDTILFFRLGDFYETFDGDAEIAARLLDIVLTGREMGKNLRVPMAGIPYHAADGYIARLIAAGHKVAVCEQVGEVTKGKGLVERDVTRVITPGTVERSGHARRPDRTTTSSAVAIDGNRAGVAYADITTGEFRTTELSRDEPAGGCCSRSGGSCSGCTPRRSCCPPTCSMTLPLPRSSGCRNGASPSKTDAWRWQANRASDALQPALRRGIARRVRLRRASRSRSGRRVGCCNTWRTPNSPACKQIRRALDVLRVDGLHDAGCANPPQPGADRKRSRANGGTA